MVPTRGCPECSPSGGTQLAKVSRAGVMVDERARRPLASAAPPGGLGIRCPDYGGCGDKGTCFGVPFWRSSLLEKEGPCALSSGSRQGDPEDAPTDWDYRPFAEGVAAAYGMSWCRRFSGTNGGGNPASLGVTHHYLGSGRALPRRVARRSRPDE